MTNKKMNKSQNKVQSGVLNFIKSTYLTQEFIGGTVLIFFAILFLIVAKDHFIFFTPQNAFWFLSSISQCLATLLGLYFIALFKFSDFAPSYKCNRKFKRDYLWVFSKKNQVLSFSTMSLFLTLVSMFTINPNSKILADIGMYMVICSLILSSFSLFMISSSVIAVMNGIPERIKDEYDS